MLFKSFDELLNSGKTYSLLYADPPWKYSRDTTGLSGCVTNRQGGEGYITMPDEDIAAMDVKRISKSNSALCMWATGARMDSAIDIMRAWGFKYKTILFVWQKVDKCGKNRFVMGNYTRPSTEFILLGTRGVGVKIPVDKKIRNMHQVVEHPMIGHSVKPEIFVRKIEELFYAPPDRLEMFARKGYEPWDLFGNECFYNPQSKLV